LISIVPNEQRFHDFIRRLRNNPAVAAGFVETVNITPEQQSDYMSRFGDRYLVALVDAQPAGYIGSIDRDIRICVHPSYQGQGVGKALIDAIMEKFPDSYARIKMDNKSSMFLFEACGFHRAFIIMTRENRQEVLQKDE